MLSIIIGEKQNRQNEVKKIVDSFLAKGKKLINFSDVTFSREQILSHTGSGDIFGTEYLVLLSQISEHNEGKDFFQNYVKTLSDSKTIFVIEETEISADLKKIFENSGAKVNEIKQNKNSNFFKDINAFQLVDAYNNRDRKNSWIIFTKLIDAGISAEEIIGAFIWNFKNLALYFSTPKPNAESLGIKPFVFSKTASASKNFSKNEINENAYKLTSILHQSHRGTVDSLNQLELFILKTI